MLYGGLQHNPPSRFLSDIDGDFQQQMTQSFISTPDPMRFQQADDPVYVPELNEGDGVRHQLFGVGTVMEIDGDTATIYFKGKGSRKLNISFAPLEKI